MGIDGEIERVVRLGVVAVAMTLVTSIGGAADAFTFALQHLYVYVYNYSDVVRKAYNGAYSWSRDVTRFHEGGANDGGAGKGDGSG